MGVYPPSASANQSILPDFPLSIINWYKGGEKSQAINACYDALPEISFPKGCAVNEGIINSLVTYRNKVWKGHGAVKVNKAELGKRVESLEQLVFHLYESIEFYDGINLIYVNEVRLPSDGVYEIGSTSLMGVNNEHLKLRTQKALTQGEIYLVLNGGSDEASEIALSPFAEWQEDSEGRLSFFYFNDAQRSKIEYLDYANGSFYYHKELKEDFQKILDISLQESSDNYEYIHFKFTQEERKKKSEEMYIHGKQLAHEKKWEDALIVFENALEWYKDAGIMIARAEMLINLKEDEEYIVSILESAAELDPDNKDIARLKRELQKKTEEGPIEEEKIKVDYNDYESYKDHIYTIYDRFMPKKLVGQGAYVVLGAVIAANLLIALAMYLLDSGYLLQKYWIAVLSLVVLETLILITIPIMKSYYSGVYYQLYSQVSNMKPERFNEWYRERVFNMFGHVRVDESGRLYFDKKKEELFTIASIGYVVIWTLPMPVYFSLDTLPFALAALQLLHLIILWIVVSQVLRPLIMSSMLISSFSKLSLNPAISDSNNQGFKALLGGFLKLMGQFAMFWLFFWTYLGVVCINPHYIDFFGVIPSCALIFSWTILTPLNIKKSSRKAQQNCLLKYQTHTIDAFNAFLKDPDEPKKKRLNWLLSSEKDLRAMIKKTISLKQNIAIILTNVWVFLCCALYFLYRLGVLSDWYARIF